MRQVRRFAGLGIAVWVLASLPAGPARAQTAPAAPPQPWDLPTVVSTAVLNHPFVAQADAEVRAAAARRGQVRSAYFPQVDAQAGYGWSQSPSPATGTQTSSHSGYIEGGVSQLLTDFGRTGASVDRAAMLAAAAEEARTSTRVEVGYAAEVAFFDVLRAAAVRAVSGETLRQRETLLRQARAFYEAGVKARIDVARAEANHLQSQADLRAAEQGEYTSRLRLLYRMGLDGPEDFTLVETVPGPEVAGTLEDWFREAEEGHPDLRALRMRYAAAQNNLRAARLNDNPVLAGNGRLGWSGEDLPEDRSWTLGVQLTIPLFNGFLTRQQGAEAAAQLEASGYALEDRRRQVRLQVEAAAAAVSDARERIQARQKAREAFQENLRLATGRYEAGAGDIIEMIDAQVQMAQADTALVEARFDLQVALASLRRAIGRLPL